MHRHLDARYQCIFINLHGLNLNGMENPLRGLATSIRRGLQRDHQFVENVVDVAGLYHDRPDKAVVLCVDEKPGT